MSDIATKVGESTLRVSVTNSVDYNVNDLKDRRKNLVVQREELLRRQEQERDAIDGAIAGIDDLLLKAKEAGIKT